MARPSIRNVKKSPRRAKPAPLPPAVEAAVEAIPPRPTDLQLVLASLRGIEEAVVRLAESAAILVARAPEAKAPRAPRAVKEDAPAVPPPEKVAKAEEHAAEMEKLRAATAAQKAEAPAGEAPPEFEAMRAAAIRFGTAKGKPALLAVMAKYIPEGAEQKLQSIPEAKRAAFMREVTA